MKMQKKLAVLLMAYGGPGSLDEVEPYLQDVRGGRPISPQALEENRRRYARIGGRSPLLDITCRQAAALEEGLSGKAKVYVGMRHWHPYIRETLDKIAADGYRDVVTVCMAPHESRMSTGAYLEQVGTARQELLTQGVALNIRQVHSWYDHPALIEAIAEKVRAALELFPGEEGSTVQALFSAHSLPASILAQGDPYVSQLQATASKVASSLKMAQETWRLVFQSAPVNTAAWLGPQISGVLEELAKRGCRNVLVAPIGFVADHLEVLYDLDIVLREQAAALGLHLERSQSLNDSPTFIAALTAAVEDALKKE